MIKLQLPKSGKINEIIHLSDIHIRTGGSIESRYTEYFEVFKNLINDLEKNENIINNSSVIILTGDIFHHKNKVESSGISLFNYLLVNLGNLAPTYIIQGNHDLDISKYNTEDMLSAFLKYSPIKNITYLKDTGYYIADKIGFGLVNIKDTLKEGDTGANADTLIPFPNPSKFPESVTKKIALFHGTVIHCKLDNNTDSLTGIPLKWFNGYDYAILGDIHIRQVSPSITNNIDDYKTAYEIDENNNKLIWGYSGSLVQQNFGESLMNHGYLTWNLLENKIIGYNVYNPYGLLKIEYKKKNWYVVSGIKLIDLLKNKLLPKKNIKIRIQGNNTHENIKELNAILSEINYEFCSQLLNNKNSDVIDTKVKIEDYSEFNNKDSWIEYIIEKSNFQDTNWKNSINHPESLLINHDNKLFIPDTLLDKVKKKNKDIELSIEKYKKSLDVINNKNKVNLHYINFDWLLCYNNNCYFNFNNLAGNVALISALNGYGKSSFLEIICLAIFGQPIPSRFNKASSGSIICKQKPEKEKACSNIIIEINNIYYSIYRIFKYNKLDKNKITIDSIEISTLSNNFITKTHLYSGSVAVNNWIKLNIGDINSFLLSCMVTQNQDQDFLSMKSDDQIQLLDKCLKFDSINCLTNLFKIACNSYKYILDHFDTSYTELIKNKKNIDANTIINIDKILNDKESLLSIISNEFDNIKEEWHSASFNENDFNLDNNILNDTILKLKKEFVDYDTDFNYEDSIIKNGIITKNLSELNELNKKYFNDEVEPNVEKIEQPLLNLELIYENLKKYNEWKDKWILFKKSRSLYEKKLAKKNIFEEKKNSILISLNDNLKPFEYQNNIDYNLLLSESSKYDNGALQFIKIDEIKEYCINNPLNIPSWNNQQIEIELNRLNKELDKNNRRKVFDDKFDDAYNSTKIKLEKIKEELLSLLQIKSDEENKITLLEDAEQINIAKLKNLNIVNKPIIDKSILLNKINNINSNKLLIDDNNNKYNLLKNQIDESNIYELAIKNINIKINDLAESIDNTEKLLKDIPYNDKCESCNKQPQRIYLKKLYDLQNNLNKEKNNLLNKNIYIATDNDKSSYELLDIWLTDYTCELANENKYLNMIKEWDIYNEYILNYHNFNNLIENARSNIYNKRKTLKNTEIEIDKIKKQVDDLNILFDEYSYTKEKLPEWKKTLDFINEQKSLFKKYENNKNIHEIYKEWNQILENRHIWESCNLYNIKKEKYNNKLSEVSSKLLDNNNYIIEYEKYLSESEYWNKFKNENIDSEQKWKNYLSYSINILEHEQKELSKIIDKYSIYQKNKAQLEYFNNIINLKPKYNRKKILKKQIQNLNFEINKIKETKIIELHNINNYNLNSEYSDKLAISIDKITKDKDTLLILSEYFADYRNWLYKTKVLPKLTDYTNNMIKSVNESNKIELEFTFSDDNKLYWLIKDGLNTIPIEKASGFQKFMLGISLRISLAHIGASSVYCNMLFLDEGFTSCDTRHLEKIPAFIHSLLNIYDSVLLVSHLEVINETADIKIKINRDMSISNIKYGNNILQ